MEKKSRNLQANQMIDKALRKKTKSRRKCMERNRRNYEGFTNAKMENTALEKSRCAIEYKEIVPEWLDVPEYLRNGKRKAKKVWQ